jgi:hypothetical protein
MIPRLEFLIISSTTLTMLHGTLLHTYKRYKVDTDRVIRWLVDNSRYKVKADVSVNILPELARNVPPDHDSENVLRILDQVIQARAECAAQYKYKSRHQASNETHEHFVSILKQVRHLLRLSRPTTATYHQPCPSTDASTLNNRFELLELQQPLEWEDTTIGSSPKKQLSAVGDDVFAHFCFLLDCHRIRKQVRRTWKQCRDKKISLIAASLTTNVAIDNITKLHNDLVAEFPAYSSYESLEQILLDNDQPMKDDSSRFHAIPEALPGHEAYNVLSHFLQGYQEDSFRDFDPEDDQHELTSSTPDSHDVTKLLARSIPDIICFLLAIGGENGPIDEFSHMLQAFYNSRELRVPLVLACDIFVDINAIFLGDVQRAYHELRASALRAAVALKKLDVHQKLLQADCSIPITRETLASINLFIETAVQDDAVANFRAAHIRPARATEPFYMLKHHPTLCGLLQFHLERSMCYVGIRLCNEWDCCMGVLHLYNVVKSQVPSWTDMETLISMYGESHLFKGKAPTKPKEQLKKYMLVAGVSDSLSRHNHRRLQQTAGVLFFVKQPLLDIMRKRYSVQEGKKESAALLEDMKHLFKSDNDNPRTSLKIRALRQWKTQKRLDPVDMLALITEGVQEEEFQLYFDFVSLNRTCIELLRRLRNSLSETVAEVHWPNHLLENQYLCGTAWFILERLSHESNLSVRVRDIVEQSFAKVVLRGGHRETEGSRSRCVQR